MKKTGPLLQSYQESLIPGCLLFMTGGLTASGFLWPWSFWLGWLLVSVLALTACVLLAKQLKVTRWYVWLTAFLLGGSCFTGLHFQPAADDIATWADKPNAEVTGTIIGLGNSPNQWVLQVDSLDRHQAQGRILLKRLKSTQLPEQLEIGNRLALTGTLSKPEPAQFPGDFDYRGYLLQQKITAILYAKTGQLQRGDSPSPWLKLLKGTVALREKVTQHFKQNLPSPEGEILASVVLGEHAVGVDKDVKTSFIRAGLIHTLAASGLNVGLIAMIFLTLGRWLRLPLRLSLGVAMLGVAFYCLLTGLPPSVQRAGMMLELAFLLKILRRELTAVTLLCISGVVLTCINPMVVTMIGFQLSFLSTFGLLVMVPPLQEKLGFYITHWGAGLLLVPLIAQLWVTPILLYYFNQVQLLSLPANLIALPIVAILTYAGFILGGLSLIVPAVSGWLLHATGFLCTGLKQIATFFGDIPLAVCYLPSPPLADIVLLMGLLILLAYGVNFPAMLPPKKLAKAVAIAFLVFLIPLSVDKWQDRHQTRVTWLSDREGNTVQILQSPPNITVMSAIGFSSSLERKIQTFARREGIAQVDVFNVVSPDMGAIKSLGYLHENIPLMKLTSPKLSSVKAQDDLIAFSQSAGIPLFPLTSTQLFDSPHLSASVYAAYPAEALHRFDLGRDCIALYWGENRLEQSALKDLSQGCSVVHDASAASELRFLSQGTPKTIPLRGFTQVELPMSK